jgi:hypothetical protein
MGKKQAPAALSPSALSSRSSRIKNHKDTPYLAETLLKIKPSTLLDRNNQEDSYTPQTHSTRIFFLVFMEYLFKTQVVRNHIYLRLCSFL